MLKWQLYEHSSSSAHVNDSQRGTPRRDSQSSPRESMTSPGTEGEKREDVENLSDLMCSLVTNNVGETRYGGMFSVERSQMLSSCKQARHQPQSGRGWTEETGVLDCLHA